MVLVKKCKDFRFLWRLGRSTVSRLNFLHKVRKMYTLLIGLFCEVSQSVIYDFKSSLSEAWLYFS